VKVYTPGRNRHVGNVSLVVTYPLPRSNFFRLVLNNENPRSLHQGHANPGQQVFHSPIRLSTPNHGLFLMTTSGFRGFLLSNVEGPYALYSPIFNELSYGVSPSWLCPGPHDHAHETTAFYCFFSSGFRAF
jgi:hypothetical protein